MSRIDTATLRRATEDVLAFGVVVSEQDADQIERTNVAIFPVRADLARETCFGIGLPCGFLRWMRLLNPLASRCASFFAER